MAASTPVIAISSSSPALTQKPPASSHRLPTQSASAALQGLQSGGASAISSGLASLDRLLSGNAPSPNAAFDRGKVAEIWGPAGAGKTAVASQAAAEAIKAGSAVSWIGCATPLNASRLSSIAGENFSDPVFSKGKIFSSKFRYLSVSTLSHLLALILHPPTYFPLEETTLLVIDDVNHLVDLDYPRYQPFNNGVRTDQQKWLGGRRYAILGSLVTALNKLAVLNNLAVIVTTGCSTRMRSDEGLPAALGPAVGGPEWEAGIWSRTVAFRDFNGRFLGVQKCQGRNVVPMDPVGDVRSAIGFEVTSKGLLREHVIDLTSSSPGEPAVTKVAPSPARLVRKRTYEEIADSEDDEIDEYGWAEADDEAITAEGLGSEQKSELPDARAEAGPA